MPPSGNPLHHLQSDHPGLIFEVERLDKQRDQPVRTESKARIAGRVNLYLSSGDYSAALDLLRNSSAEFPNDAEFSALERISQGGVERKAQANGLITESQELFALGKTAEAIQVLRRAYELDKHNSLARTILANALVEHAYSIVETDWWEAETLANEALKLNPAHPTAKNINNLILERKMAGSVEEWVAQTRKLQSAGNLSAALAQIAEGFVVYPHEPKLLLIQDAIQRDHGTQRRQARRRDLDDLRRMASEIDGAADVAAKKALADRIKAVSTKYSTDGEILSIANALLLHLGLIGAPEKISRASPAGEGVAAANQAPRPSSLAIAPEVLEASISEVPSNWIPPKNTQADKVPPSGTLPSIIPPREHQPGNVPAGTVPTVPAGQIQTAQAAPLLVAAPAEAAATVISTSVTSASVTSLTSSPSTSSSSNSSSAHRPKPATRPNSTKPILLFATAIVVVGAMSYVAGTRRAPPVKEKAAESPNVSTPAVSVPAPTTSEATPSRLPLSSDTTPVKATLGPQERAVSAPAPSAFGESGYKIPGQNLGSLLVVAGQDDARVFLNGEVQSKLTQAGQLRLPNLELKDYVVQVSKNGFQDSPQQKIHIRKGEEATLVFSLQPQLRLATLTIQGGAPGTTVFVDQSVVGTVQSDGTLSVSNINPGDHRVELRREQFKARQLRKHFVAGETISLAGADDALEAAAGELKVTFAPADANVAIAKSGGLPIIVSSGVPLTLAPGTYTLTARTAERFTRSSTLEVIGGQSRSLDLSLAPNGMSKWDDPGAWKHEKDSFIRKGGEFVLYGVVPASGTFVFSAMPAKGRILQWVVNYTDSKNYVLFQMDEDNFYRTVIRDGEKRDEIKIADKGDKKSFRTLRVRVSPTEIVHQIQHGTSSTVLDRWTQPGGNLSLGRFGFYLPGSNEVEVSSFAYYADLNIR